MKNSIVDDPTWPEYFSQLRRTAKDPRLKRYYSASVTDDKIPISDTPMVAMDFETTGLDPASCDIVSIGLIPFTLQRIHCRQAKHWLLNPSKPLGEQSIVIHGITHSEVNEAPRFEAVMGQLLEELAGKIVVVHYRQIERSFLLHKVNQLLGETFCFPVIDTMEVERRAMDARRGMLGKLLRRPLGSLRLSDARKRYRLPGYSAHHAMTDALATAELLQAQIAYHYRMDTPLRELWL